MNISGIGAYSGSYNYNSIQIGQGASRVSSLRNQPQVAENTTPKTGVSEAEIKAARAGQTFNSEKLASQYKAGAGAAKIGTDADVAKLDEAGKASNTGKSQLMQQYQMFMGEKNPVATARATENFSF